MLNIKTRLADFFGVLTPQLKTAGVFKSRQKFPINPALTPDHASNRSVTDPGLRTEVTHRRDCPRTLQYFQHVLDVSSDLDGAIKHGIIDRYPAKSRPLTTPREIAGTSGWGASGHAHQSKGEK